VTIVTAVSPIASTPDRLGVGPQLAQVGEERRGVEQRRQEDQQHEIWLELDRWNPGREAER
jgi:hypothetical protein